MNKPIPLSQLADTLSGPPSLHSPIASYSGAIAPRQESSSKNSSPCKGEVTEGQRGKKARSDDSVYFVTKTFTLFGAASAEPG